MGGRGAAAGAAPAGGTPTRRIGFFGLVCLVVSAMLGGGVYNLPKSVAVTSGPAAVALAWVVTGVGMVFVVNTFRVLSLQQPELKNGIYTYAERGFGPLAGYLVAYGYWVCNIFAMVAYGVLLPATLDAVFLGVFGDGSNWASVALSSCVTWAMFLLARRGAESSAAINVVGTVCKVVPIVLFACLLASRFSLAFVGEHLAGSAGLAGLEPAAFLGQVGDTMTVTLFLFIGVEGAVVVSGEAKSAKAVSAATVAGYVVVLVLYVLVSLLPFGCLTQDQVAAAASPSMASILDALGMGWASAVVKAGVVVSLLSAWLVWTVMLGQMPLFAARDHVFPAAFARENRFGAPTFSLFVTCVLIQCMLVAAHFLSGAAWSAMVNITAVMAMPCYLVCCLFLLKLALRGPWGGVTGRRSGLVTGALGSLFSAYLVLEAGVQLLAVACILYAAGLPVYLWARRGERLPRGEQVLALCVLAAAVAGVVLIVP